MSVRVLPMLGTWQRKRRGSTPLSRDRHESAYALQLPELLVMLAFLSLRSLPLNLLLVLPLSLLLQLFLLLLLR